MTKEDLIIEKLDELRKTIERIEAKSKVANSQRDLQESYLKSIFDKLCEIAENTKETAKNTYATIGNTTYLKSFDSAICDIQYQLNSVLSLLQDKLNVDSDSKEVAQ